MQLRHLNIDLYDCIAALDDSDFLTALLRRAGKDAGVTVVDSLTHRFVPHGITVVLILAESHLIISTWPEYRYANLDIFLCNGEMVPEQIYNSIKLSLSPTKTKVHVLDHPSPN